MNLPHDTQRNFRLHESYRVFLPFSLQTLLHVLDLIGTVFDDAHRVGPDLIDGYILDHTRDTALVAPANLIEFAGNANDLSHPIACLRVYRKRCRGNGQSGGQWVHMFCTGGTRDDSRPPSPLRLVETQGLFELISHLVHRDTNVGFWRILM